MSNIYYYFGLLLFYTIITVNNSKCFAFYFLSNNCNNLKKLKNNLEKYTATEKCIKPVSDIFDLLKKIENIKEMEERLEKLEKMVNTGNDSNSEIVDSEIVN